jgi:hypothetical protein
MMKFDPSFVDIMTSESPQRVKYCLCIGYHISKGLYSMQKFGLISRWISGEVHPQEKLMTACKNTYNGIPTSGEIAIPIFGYDLGEYCEYDDEGEPIGKWPQIGEAKIKYTEKFLMKGGRLPPGYDHLIPMRWFKP